MLNVKQARELVAEIDSTITVTRLGRDFMLTKAGHITHIVHPEAAALIQAARTMLPALQPRVIEVR